LSRFGSEATSIPIHSKHDKLPAMWILIINLLLLPDPQSTQPLPFTYIERESRIAFTSIEDCERELHRWYAHIDDNIGDEARELPEAEGNERWTAVYAECVSTSPAIS